MFETDLSSQVPVHGAQNGSWRAAACCQMAMQGYPPGATSCSINQTAIWNHIQAHNKEPGANPAWGIGWFADPYAVTKTLNDLCPPQFHWADVSGTDRNAVLYTLLRYMANYQYASLVCVFTHDYWNLLVYYRTSADPRTVSNPTLERVGLYAPYQGGCNYHEVDGSVFMSSPAWWGAPCNGSTCGVLWDGKWVGIGEPPEVEGRVKVQTVVRDGTKLIGPTRALQVARTAYSARGAERAAAAGRQSALRARRPLLVREAFAPLTEVRRKARRAVRYYLVPFASEHDIDASGAECARACVAVNAATGRFEELTVFAEPVSYLPQRQALRIARASLGLTAREAARATLELVSNPSPSALGSAVPVWSVAVLDHSIFVTQDGGVLGSLTYPTYRGA